MLNKVILTARVSSHPKEDHQGNPTFRVQYMQDYFTVKTIGKARDHALSLSKGEIIHLEGMLKNEYMGEVDGRKQYVPYIHTHFFCKNSSLTDN